MEYYHFMETDETPTYLGKGINVLAMERHRLLKEIAPRPAIWDTRLSVRDRRQALNDDWQQVAQAMNSDVDECKRKWKIMRGTFRSELRRVAATGVPSRWHLFDEMQFMRNVFVHSASSPPYITPVVTPQKVLLDHVFPTTVSSLIPIPQDLSHSSNPICPEEILPDCLMEETVVTIQDDPLQDLETDPSDSLHREGTVETDFLVDPNDSDYRFLISLLPFISTLPKFLKNRFQHEALGLVLDLHAQYPQQVQEKVEELAQKLGKDQQPNQQEGQDLGQEQQDPFEEHPQEKLPEQLPIPAKNDKQCLKHDPDFLDNDDDLVSVPYALLQLSQDPKVVPQKSYPIQESSTEEFISELKEEPST
ncbi:uncharacterized protein LOC26514665 [Drosophila ananassae]|uniref:uncharacterized protein LOC26514665 n=1 Tax=Drosophila ananassae TaxID=7217 RepID=UPI0013A5CF30|nr:uncharacterized protein LOC26514665 [Drosophila ananassae]